MGGGQKAPGLLLGGGGGGFQRVTDTHLADAVGVSEPLEERLLRPAEVRRRRRCRLLRNETSRDVQVRYKLCCYTSRL